MTLLTTPARRWLLWLAALGPIVVYPAIFQAMRDPLAQSSVPVDVFLTVTAVVLAIGLILPTVLHRQALASLAYELVDEVDPAAIAGFRSAAPRRRVHEDPEATLAAARQATQTSLLTAIAFAISLSSLASVAYFLSGGLAIPALAMPGGLLIWALNAPTDRRLRAGIERRSGVPLPR